jgi:hypothetical protein
MSGSLGRGDTPVFTRQKQRHLILQKVRQLALKLTPKDGV